MRNVEIKARIRDYDEICRIAEELSGGPPTIIKQDDTFYRTQEGRLKLRFFEDSSATLVRYDREEKEGPMLSDYDLLHFSAAESDKAKLLDKMLKKALGDRGRIVKERKLYMVGQTRVHIDDVQGFGIFMELEVVLRDDQTVAEGQDIALDLQKKLGVHEDDLLHLPYIDLLNIAG